MADEIINFSDEASVKSTRSKKKKKRAHPWAFPLGLAIAVLTVTGLVTVVLAGINTVKRAVVKAKNIEEYNKMLIPVVMNDPDMFDDVSKANMGQLLEISIWAILRSDISPDKYDYVENNMVIPEADVTAQYTKLFGTEVPPVHNTVSGYGYEFVYNSTEKQYLIPLTGIEPIYTPRVTEVHKKSNTIVLTVAYLAADGWAQNETGDMIAPEPDKYVKVTLREGSDGNYYITAMQLMSAPEAATTSPNQPAPVPTTVVPAPTTAPAEETQTEAASADEAETQSESETRQETETSGNTTAQGGN